MPSLKFLPCSVVTESCAWQVSKSNNTKFGRDQFDRVGRVMANQPNFKDGLNGGIDLLTEVCFEKDPEGHTYSG